MLEVFLLNEKFQKCNAPAKARTISFRHLKKILDRKQVQGTLYAKRGNSFTNATHANKETIPDNYVVLFKTKLDTKKYKKTCVLLTCLHERNERRIP